MNVHVCMYVGHVMYLAWMSLRLGFIGDPVRELATSDAPIPEAHSPPTTKHQLTTIFL